MEERPERGLADRVPLTSSVTMVRQGSGGFHPAAWMAEPGAVLETTTPHTRAAPAPQLFPSMTRRAILSAALATPVPEGELDLDRIIDVLSDGRPIEALPRLPAPTLRRGAPVLIDRCQ